MKTIEGTSRGITAMEWPLRLRATRSTRRDRRSSEPDWFDLPAVPPTSACSGKIDCWISDCQTFALSYFPPVAQPCVVYTPSEAKNKRILGISKQIPEKIEKNWKSVWRSKSWTYRPDCYFTLRKVVFSGQLCKEFRIFKGAMSRRLASPNRRTVDSNLSALVQETRVKRWNLL